MTTIHKIMTQEKHVIYPLTCMSEEHNNIIDVITKKITIKA